jgi:hypothetical protein
MQVLKFRREIWNLTFEGKNVKNNNKTTLQ